MIFNSCSTRSQTSGAGLVPYRSLGPLIDQLPQVRDFGLAGRHREMGKQDPPQLQLDLGPLRDHQRVVAGPGESVVGEQLAHLRGRLQVVVAALESETGGVAAQGPGLDTEQDVMSIVLVSSGVVSVVRRQQRSAGVRRDGEEVGHDRLLRRQPVVLDLDEEVLLAKDVLELAGCGDGGLVVTDLSLVPLLTHRVRCQELGHHSAQTTRGGDDPLGVLRQEVEVHSRLVVVALEERLRRELEQVPVADLSDGEEVHVKALVGAAKRPIEA